MPLKHTSIFTFGILLILGGIMELVQRYTFIIHVPYFEVFLLMTIGLFLSIYGALPRALSEQNLQYQSVTQDFSKVCSLYGIFQSVKFFLHRLSHFFVNFLICLFHPSLIQVVCLSSESPILFKQRFLFGLFHCSHLSQLARTSSTIPPFMFVTRPIFLFQDLALSAK